MQIHEEVGLDAAREGVGIMPSYQDKLAEEQIDALAAYIAGATGAGQ
jgi:mono/diheme cytochrome c family protein